MCRPSGQDQPSQRGTLGVLTLVERLLLLDEENEATGGGGFIGTESRSTMLVADLRRIGSRMSTASVEAARSKLLMSTELGCCHQGVKALGGRCVAVSAQTSEEVKVHDEIGGGGPRAGGLNNGLQ